MRSGGERGAHSPKTWSSEASRLPRCMILLDLSQHRCEETENVKAAQPGRRPHRCMHLYVEFDRHGTKGWFPGLLHWRCMSCRAMLNPGSMEHEVVSVPMSRPDDAVTAPSRVRMTRPRDNEGRFARSDSGSDVARCACVQTSRPPQPHNLSYALAQLVLHALTRRGVLALEGGSKKTRGEKRLHIKTVQTVQIRSLGPFLSILSYLSTVHGERS